LVIAGRIDITIGATIGAPDIEAAADEWAREQYSRHRVQALQWSRKLFVQTATNWLHFLGRLEEPQPKIVPFADRLADFAAYQREERGLSPATISGQGWQVEKFLSWLSEQNRSFDDVSLEDVDAFLAGNGKRGWGRVSVSTRAKALRAFFRHAATRGWCSARIAGAAGLRISEALSLRLTNVDLTDGVLTICESKFYKTRLVPMSPALTGTVGEYVAQRAKEHPTQLDGALFLTRTGVPVARHTAENVFTRLRVRAGVLRHDGGRYQPRLHDLRHAFAVHLLVSWYRQGADVQRLLPQLATYLGHVHIAATQRYLTLTPELLHEASQRFERYAQEGQHE
jgi:site-specific recombinase XerD